jgi:hypothetical protein
MAKQAREKVRAGDYLCTHCWTDNGLTDSAEFFSCRACGRRDRLVPKKPNERHGLDLRCPSPPPGYLRCPDETAAACPVCSVYKAFVAGGYARLRDDDASRRELREAMRYIDVLRSSQEAAYHPVIRLWDESGYEGGWARIANTDLDWIKLEFRRCPLTYAQVRTGHLAPIPETTAEAAE